MRTGKWARLAVLVAGALAAATLLIACGGGDDDSNGNGGGGGNGGAKADTPEAYAKAVCETLGDRFKELDRLMEGSDMEDPEQLRDAIEEVQPALKEMSENLDDIDPPDEVEEWHNKMVSALAQASELFGKLGDVLDKPIDEAMAAMEELTPELEEMQSAFEGVSELPPQYRRAFETVPACAGLDMLSE